MTLPNQITLLRIVLAIVFFAVLSFFDATRLDETRWLVTVAFVLFVVAAISDWLDGMLARRLDVVSTFGRVIDPVADKVLICGAFLFFSSDVFFDGAQNITGVAAWMSVVVLGRELLVTALRSHSEASGSDFSAVWSGKIKMFVQSITAGVILGRIAFRLDSFAPLATVLIYATVIVTLISMLTYLNRAKGFLLESRGKSPEPSPHPSPDRSSGGPHSDSSEGSESHTRVKGASA